jgi:hypothetical protein
MAQGLPLYRREDYSAPPPVDPTLPESVNSRQREPMSHTTPSLVRSTLVCLSLGLLGCGSDLVLPESPSSAAETILLTKRNGDKQTGAVGERLQGPLEVQVLNQDQQGVSGLSVMFELTDPAGGTLDPVSATTNSAGQAFANWTLGTVPGSYTVVARLVGVEGEDKVAEFHSTAIPGAPAAMSAQSPQLQSGRREQPVESPPTVQVLDRFGNPVPGIAIDWQVIAGGGEATPINGNTDAEGKATVNWTLGNEAGVHKLSASVAGAAPSIVFQAHVLF